jgi:hypothetical protein
VLVGELRQDIPTAPFCGWKQYEAMRGTVRKISIPRRLIVDLMRASIGVPFVSLRRNLDIRPLLEARAAASRPPGWAAIFVRAFGLVAQEQPILRTLYVKWPWPHFYEMPRSIGMVAIARVENGEDCVLLQKISLGEGEQALPDIDQRIRMAKTAPIDEIPAFRKMLTATRLPLPLRRLSWLVGLNFGRQRANFFGNFAVTSVSAYGPGELHALSPGPYIVSYGVVAPDRTMDVVIRWDHRVADAALVAKAFTRLEQVLNTEIAAELGRDSKATEPLPVRAIRN